jgi:molybdopterin/thiamine biosynthesis adenylyltransferase/proteasome lid subunit RPN8/RPN11
MVTPTKLTSSRLIVRFAEGSLNELQKVVFRRYPSYEWATFARFGWRHTADALVVTFASIDAPTVGDLNEDVGHVAIDEQYSLRMALNAEKHRLAVGVIHSHPKGGAPFPSHIDDDMDTYYARYFSDFAPNRPYVSLILSMVRGKLVISGRAYWQGSWFVLDHSTAERGNIETWPGGHPPVERKLELDCVARFASAFGDEALRLLRRSTVAIIGAGGTGSAVIEVLARAGIGRLILVDPDTVDRSNLERIHGSYRKDNGKAKVLVASDHVKAIDPSIIVEAFCGRLPQSEIVDAVVTADIALGCTDQQHSRLALSDLAFRYLVPSMDCGVVLEGKDGTVTAQVAQFIRFLAADPCALCRDIIVPEKITQELMSEEEKAQRRQAAEEAVARGEDPNPYWKNTPQINTVGYLTTAVGAMMAGYSIGWLTKRFDAPFQRLQMNFVAKYLDVTDLAQHKRSTCPCASFIGWADQAAADSLISAPDHWPSVTKL